MVNGDRMSKVETKRKKGYRNLAVIVLPLFLAVAAGIGVFVYKTVFADPFPKDESLTKDWGTVATEIDKTNNLYIRYPSFEDKSLDNAVAGLIEQYEKEASEERKIIVDYRSSKVFDAYATVLFKETKSEDGKETITYHSINYDLKGKKVMDVDDIFRNQYERDLFDGASKKDVDAIEIQNEQAVVYFDNGKTKTIPYEENKAYIALTDPNIPSLFQQEPLKRDTGTAIDPDKPMVAFTFDDGPNPNTTPRLLDTLKKYDAKATFFMVGQNVVNYPDIVKRIYMEGHEIGNHSWSHEDLGAMTSADDIIQGYQKADDAIFAACGHDPQYVRPPFGSMSELYNKTVDRESILWSIDTRDWESHNPASIRSIIDTYVADGSVILMHDIHSESVDSMDAILAELQEKGYQFVTIDDLFKYGKI